MQVRVTEGRYGNESSNITMEYQAMAAHKGAYARTENTLGVWHKPLRAWRRRVFSTRNVKKLKWIRYPWCMRPSKKSRKWSHGPKTYKETTSCWASHASVYKNPSFSLYHFGGTLLSFPRALFTPSATRTTVACAQEDLGRVRFLRDSPWNDGYWPSTVIK